MTSRRLIINADDFGFSGAINRAVARAVQAGTVTSVSLMTGGGALAEALNLIEATPGLGVGLHFALTQGRPLSNPGDVPTLCDGRGDFLSRGRLLAGLVTGRVRRADIRTELAAQLAAAGAAGPRLTHLDGHQHVHVLPGVAEEILAAAARLGLAVRIPQDEFVWLGGPGRGLEGAVQVARKVASGFWPLRTRRLAASFGVRINDHFRSPFSVLPPVREVTPAVYGILLKKLRPGVTEIMVHPAETTDALARLWVGNPRLMADRLAEAAILTSPEFKRSLAACGAGLINYGGL